MRRAGTYKACASPGSHFVVFISHESDIDINAVTVHHTF